MEPMIENQTLWTAEERRHQLECGAAMRNDSSEPDSTCSKRRPGGGACLVEKHFPSMPLLKQPRGSCGQLRSEGLWRYLKLFGDWNESQCNVPSASRTVYVDLDSLHTNTTRRWQEERQPNDVEVSTKRDAWMDAKTSRNSEQR